ncbi:MAG: hypothetical protein ACOCUH_03030, partial [Bacteriovoracia bacterium]
LFNFFIWSGRLRLEKEELIGFLNEDSFEQALRKHEKGILEVKFKLLQELKQKLSTLKAINSRLRDNLEDIAQTRKPFAKIKKFEKDYQKEYGTFLSTVLVDNHKEYLDQFDKYPRLRKSFKNMDDLAKRLADNTMNLLNRMGQVRILKGKKKKQILKQIEINFSILNDDITLEKQEITNMLSNVNKE